MELMGGKIKKFFLNFNRFNKPAVLAAVFFSIFLGLALPLQFVQAQLGLIIGTAVAVTIINLVLQLVLVISNLILGLAGVILSWVLSPYFMSLPYTYGGIVDVGWPIVRDFINMFFIIALVIIGLATALRIKEYQAQKTLPLLIIIAILINFTPVICGLILDASNILMNFFLEELTGFKMLGNMFSAQGTMLLGALQHFYNPLESLALMGKTLVMIIFDWVAAFIFFMFALLFVMRYVMIWVLVIVSPIAFFSRIFPASQRYLFKSILGWDEWWKQFIEWSIIGIVAAFFIYLAEQLMVMAPGWIPGIPPGGVWGIITTPLVDFINNLLPWGVMLAFLMIGFFVATSTSAMGATAITKLAKKSMTGMRKAAAGMAWGGIKQVPSLVGGIGGRIGGGLERFAAEHPKMAAPITAPTRLAKWAGRGVAKIIPEKVKTGASYAGRGLQTAWGEVGKPIFKAGWEPFRKEIFGPRRGEEPEMPGRPEKAPGETDEEFASRLEDWEGEVREWTRRPRREGPPPATPPGVPPPKPTRPTPPPGIPSNWVPGPRGIWVPPSAAAAVVPTEEERLLEEWPKAEKGMPKDIKDAVKEGQKYIETLGEKIKGLDVLNESIGELKRDLTSLKEKTIKTPTDEELIRRMEVELLPAREEESRLTEESMGDIRSRLENLRERIKPWEEHKKAVGAGGKEEERVKEVYKRLKKEAKEIKKKK